MREESSRANDRKEREVWRMEMWFLDASRLQFLRLGAYDTERRGLDEKTMSRSKEALRRVDFSLISGYHPIPQPDQR